jgi:hypothetical protein
MTQPKQSYSGPSLANVRDVRERPAREGETCECGRPAVVVFLTEKFGEVPYCGIADGGRRS